MSSKVTSSPRKKVASSPAVLLPKGSNPEIVANIVQPKDQMSDGRSNGYPRIHSGAHDPISTDVGRHLAPRDDRNALPKSAIIMDPLKLKGFLTCDTATMYRGIPGQGSTGRPSSLGDLYRRGFPKCERICWLFQDFKPGI